MEQQQIPQNQVIIYAGIPLVFFPVDQLNVKQHQVNEAFNFIDRL